MAIQSHRDLIVWQRGVDLAIECYSITREFPEYERLGLSSQIQRAASSVPANIAEGKARGTTKAFLNYLTVADGSLAEVDTHLEVAARLGYVSHEKQQALLERINELGRMLTGLRKSVRRRLS